MLPVASTHATAMRTFKQNRLSPLCVAVPLQGQVAEMHDCGDRGASWTGTFDKYVRSVHFEVHLCLSQSQGQC